MAGEEFANDEYGYACRIDNIKEAAKGNKVMSGCLVSDSAPDAMTYDMTVGRIRINDVYVAVSAVADQAVTAADGTHDRYDIVYVGENGTVDYTAGAAIANPYPPNLPADHILLAILFVENNSTVVESADVVDSRIIEEETFEHFHDIPWIAETDLNVAGAGISDISPPYLKVRGQAGAADRTVYIDKVGIDFDKPIHCRFRFTHVDDGAAETDMNLGIRTDHAAFAGNQIGLKCDDAGPAMDWFFTTGDTVAEETTDIANFVSGTSYDIEFIHTPGVSVKLYVDGVLLATHTTRVPSGTESDKLFFAFVNSPGAGGQNIYIGPLKIYGELIVDTAW